MFEDSALEDAKGRRDGHFVIEPKRKKHATPNFLGDGKITTLSLDIDRKEYPVVMPPKV